MRDLFFFDANVRLGSPMNGGLQYAADVPALLQEMDRNGVESALVRAMNTAEAGALYANGFVAEALAGDGSGRLHGVWTWLPAQTGEMPSGTALFGQLAAGRFRAVQLLPVAHGWVVSAWTLGAFMGEAAACRLPVVLNLTDYRDWDAVYALVTAYPRNRYVFQTTGLLWGSDRYFRPLLEQCPGFHVDLSCYWIPEGIAELVRSYGDERLLYGSGYPQYTQGSMMLALRHADIPALSKQRLAGGNLRRLLEEVRL